MRRSLRGLLALTAGLVMAMPALAQGDSTPPATNQEIVQQCIEDFRAVVTETRTELADQTRAAVEQLRTLSMQGAPKPAILEASRQALVQNGQTAQAGHQAVRGAAGECFEALRENEAPRATGRVVKQGAKIASRLIHRGADRTRTIVRVATRQAIKGTGSGEAPVVTDQDIISDAEISEIAQPGQS